MWSVLGAHKMCCVPQNSIPSPPATLSKPPKSYGQANELARLRDQLDGQRVQSGGGGRVRSTQGLSSIGYNYTRFETACQKAFHNLGSLFTYESSNVLLTRCSASALWTRSVHRAGLMMALASSSKDARSLRELASASKTAAAAATENFSRPRATVPAVERQTPSDKEAMKSTRKDVHHPHGPHGPKANGAERPTASECWNSRVKGGAALACNQRPRPSAPRQPPRDPRSHYSARAYSRLRRLASALRHSGATSRSSSRVRASLRGRSGPGPQRAALRSAAR
jgi:hypothetical protein